MTPEFFLDSMARPEVEDWLGEAEADLRHSEDCLKLKRYNWACFSAQQAAEKALKAFLMGFAKKRPSHVHDLTKLYAETKGKLALPQDVVKHLGELSSYYTLARYPNAGLTRPSIGINKLQAGRALTVSRKILERIEDAFKTPKRG